ncbi:aldose 1-epimerase family protein [Yeosuana sp.]|uniref:aldose 1-epimerase family protein n=1 Tax=Yeosuana sp. TaxID=2529388 RepID=UPI004054FA06
MYTLENTKLKIAIKKIGAELCQISSIKNINEFMWDANPAIWANHAPILFPIIGALKQDSYYFENKKYSLGKHGFIRNNEDIILHEQTQNSLTFKLSENENTLKSYPFKFEFYITYKLIDNVIEVVHTVKNCDIQTMYFSLGGHPAFKCPLYSDENYEDYFLEFEHVENSVRHLINMEIGLISSSTNPVFNHSNKISLTHDLFNEDALVFKDLKSRKVTLKSGTYGAILSLHFKEFPYFGIWAKPNGNYVCLEPWLGVADPENTNQDLKTKEGILSLKPKETFAATYRIEIHNNHLV